MSLPEYFCFLRPVSSSRIGAALFLALNGLAATGEAAAAVSNANVAQAAPAPDGVRSIAPDVALARIAKLRAEIARHDELYYKKSAPEISDAAYDLLKRELTALERAYPRATENTPPISALGDDRTGAFPLHRHRERMLSLDKSYSEVELRAFHARLIRQLGRDDLSFVVEPKFDGLAISVTYEKGKLIRAVTRGNGVEGDDVTANALTIPTLRRELLRVSASDGTANAIPDFIELRGEVYLPFAEFERINRERESAGEAPFSHPRNLAAGTLKQLDPREVAERKLAIVFYGWGACEPATASTATQREFHKQVRAWGLPGLEKFTIVRNADEMWTAVQAFDRERSSLAFPVDGAVVKLDAVSLQRALGASEQAPHWAMAYKFAPQRAETELLAITVQVGRTGVLTPVAELAPVQIGGSTVARASLHNRDEIARDDVRVGDFVYVEKAGEIIPAIVGVNTARRRAASQPFIFPTTCPACQRAVVNQSGEAAVRCPNSDCPAQLRRKLQHFASESCVDIEGFGPALVDVLVDNGRVKSVADLYRLRREDLAPPGSSAGKTAEQVLVSIERSKHAELWRFVHGLGIPQIGAVASRELARQFRGLDTLADADAEDFSSGSISAQAAASVVNHFSEPKNRAVVAELLALGVQPKAPFVAAAKPAFTGKIFVLTGTLPHLSRAQAEEKILAAGGRVSSSVSRKTNYVLVGEGSGGKLAAAQSLGVAVIDEAEFLRMLQEN